MSAFGPGIGEKDIVRRDGFGRQHMCDQVRRFDLDEPDICQPFPMDLLLDFLEAFIQLVQAEKIDLRVLQCPGAEESSLSAADIDLHRLRLRKKFAQRQRTVQGAFGRLQDDVRQCVRNG